MRQYFNVFYLLVIITGLILWRINASMNKAVVTFYGFAENKETEINFNYPVAVEKIHVLPGEMVQAGTPLLDIYRIKAKETLTDQPFRVNELNAKAQAWRTKKEGDVKLMASKKRLRVAEIDQAIEKLRQEQKFQKSLYQDLKSVASSDENSSPIAIRIKALEKEKKLVIANFDQAVENLQAEMKVGNNPFLAEIERLQAEQAFDAANKQIDIQLKAPSDGLIGNIYCKEAEHIPSYKTLVSFYEPNPSLVKGFVQEDLILHVALKDSFLIKSAKDPTNFCYGIVTGLGSRIVEIPERLRKMAGFKTYGREISVSIPTKNNFLQKEKVILEFINPPAGIDPTIRRRPMVDLKVN